jgi:hypothetical protein
MLMTILNYYLVLRNIVFAKSKEEYTRTDKHNFQQSGYCTTWMQKQANNIQIKCTILIDEQKNAH